MNIQIDTREKARAIRLILASFDSMGVKYFSNSLPVGDYFSLDRPRLYVDRKQNLSEIAANLTPTRDKNGKYNNDLRFVRELKKARDMGVSLVILCEHGSEVKDIEDVRKWQNPRLREAPFALSGERLYQKMKVLEKTYPVRFLFCDKVRTGKCIVEILGGETDE